MCGAACWRKIGRELSETIRHASASGEAAPDCEPRNPGYGTGMPVEAFIRTGERTVLSYLFKPLADQARRAFREK